MIKYYITDNGKIQEQEEFTSGSWVMATAPTYEESVSLANEFKIDIADVRAAMDDEESSRVDVSNDEYTLIVVDIPAIEIIHERENYTTIPLGIIIKNDLIVTVCAEESPVLQYFVRNNVKSFSTKKQMRFVYQILHKTCMVYQNNLRVIDKKRTELEERAGDRTEDRDLVALHELEATLVYFATSLRANGVIIERLTRYGKIKQFPDDQELLEDVIVENKQAIEMTSIYRDILTGTRELMSTLISNRLNMVMKYLAAITIVMSIPNIISGLYGMNLDKDGMPLAYTDFGFGIICLVITVLCLLSLVVMKKKQML